jgi:hypothetical protein
MRRYTAKQLSFLPGTNTARSWELKPAPRQEEAAFMRSLQDAARLLGIVTVHLQTFCNNHFYVTCPACKRPILAHCKAHTNAEYAGYPDLLIVRAGIECKVDRNQRGEPCEPSPVQLATHGRLRAANVPVAIISPGNVQEGIDFLRNLTRKRAETC